MDIQVQELINKIKRMKSSARANRMLNALKKPASPPWGRRRATLFWPSKGKFRPCWTKLSPHRWENPSDDVLKAVIPELIKSWSTKRSGGGASSLAVLLPEASLGKLQAFFKTKLAAELKKGLELRADRNLAGGFRIAQKDGSAYYDFSADSVAEMLCVYLNPKLAEILKASASAA